MKEKRKLLLVALDSKFIHSNLAVRYLKSYIKDLDIDVSIKNYTINDRLENILMDIMDTKPEFIGFSCYIWNIDMILKLVRLIKLINKDIKIFLGGPEVTYDSKKALMNSEADYIIEGEGEVTFHEFIEKRLSKEDTKLIKGLFTKEEGKVYYGGKRPLMDMNEVPFPYTKEDIPKDKIVYYESSRGCPFSCKYCLSSTIHGVRFLPVERVKREIKFFVDNGIKLVKFVDRTFNSSPKFSCEVWKYIISLNTDCRFHFEISADILNKEEIELLKGCPEGRIQFEIGIQSTNNEVLKKVSRSAPFDEIKEYVTSIKNYTTIKQHVDLIAGLPGEDLKSFIKSFNDVYTIEAEEIQLGFLKVLKGCPLEKEAEEFGLVYSPYHPYEILKTKHMSYEDLRLLKIVEDMVDKFYNSGKYKNIIKILIRNFESPFEFYKSLGEYFKEMKLNTSNLSLNDSYTVFLSFNKRFSITQEDILKDIIKYDLLMFNKNKKLPDLLKENMDKAELKEVKDKILKEEKLDFKYYHIEKFNYDLEAFMNEGKKLKKPHYILFKDFDLTYFKIIK